MIPQVDPGFKSLIPPPLEDERAQLEQNILADGKCIDAIILWDGLIVDGHNRFEICMKHGIEFEITEMEFSSREAVMVWILDNQLGRRNLNDAARIEIALAKVELLRERARENRGGRPRKDGEEKPCPKTTKLDNGPFHVLNALADDAGVGKGTVHRYMDVKQNGSPELVERVKSGELKIGTAHRMLGKEILKQLRNADKMYAYLTETLREITAKSPDPENDPEIIEIYSRLNDLYTLLTSLLSQMEEEDASCMI